jgi:hypothetical protein
VICPVLGREKLKAGNIQVDPFRDFVETIVSGDSATAIRLLDASPLLAKERAAHGATRQAAKQNFFDQILHYMYEGDTALHIAAAAYQIRIAEELIARGASMAALTRAPPTGTARHCCFSQLRTPVAVVQDLLKRRRSRKRFCAFSWSMGPRERCLCGSKAEVRSPEVMPALARTADVVRRDRQVTKARFPNEPPCSAINLEFLRRGSNGSVH